MNAKNKTLFILPTLHAGGAENYLLRFLTYCKIHLPFEATVLALNEEKRDLHEEFDALGCKIIYQSIAYLNPIKFFRYYQFLRNEKFDIICTFTGNFGGIPLLISYIAGIKKRIAWHRRSTDAFSSDLLKQMYNTFVGVLVRKLSTSILSNSQEAMVYFYGKEWSKDKRMKIIPNGISPESVHTSLNKDEARMKLALPKDALVIGHVGRFTPEKNHIAIFNFIREFSLQSNSIIGLFCGRGTDSNDFISLQKEYGIEDKCVNLGQRRDIGTVLKAIDVFFFPSVSEGNPNALIEAMIAGCNIIASDIGPHMECTPMEYHKYLVPTSDIIAHMKMINRIMKSSFNNFDIDLKDYCEKKFNGEKNFMLFKNEIFNY